MVLLVRALVVRKVRTIEVASVDGGVISVTRDAIAAQASHIVEADGTCSAARVIVDARARGHVRVHVRVLLHGLAKVCGDKVEDVSLEFVEPESVTVSLAEVDEPAADGGLAPAEPDSTSEITVSMGAARESEREA